MISTKPTIHESLLRDKAKSVISIKRQKAMYPNALLRYSQKIFVME